jgi:hypothetical protein
MSARDRAYQLARQLVIETNQQTSAPHGDGFTAAEHTAGALLAAIASELRVAFSKMPRLLVLAEPRADRLAFDAAGHFVRLAPDGCVEPARPVEVARAEPDVRHVLNRIEAALLALELPVATAGAMFVRDVLERGLAGPAVHAPPEAAPSDCSIGPRSERGTHLATSHARGPVDR